MGSTLVIAIFIIGSIIKYLSNPDKGSLNAPPSAGSGQGRAPTDTEQERLRRFREAVGLPTDLPPPVRPQSTGSHGPLLPVNPPPGTVILTTPGRLRRVPPVTVAPRVQPTVRNIPPIPAPAPVATFSEPAATVAQMPPAPATRESESAVAAKRPAIGAGGLALRLRDPAAIREAMILREVLGPPRAFVESGMGLMGPLGLMRPSAPR